MKIWLTYENLVDIYHRRLTWNLIGSEEQKYLREMARAS